MSNRLKNREYVVDLLARALVATLFALQSINLLVDFGKTHRVTGLLLLVSEALVVVMTVLRRPARLTDRSAAARIVTTISLMGPPLLRPATNVPPLAPDLATAMISAMGLIVVIAGKITLGRSFGIIPANRGVVIGGPYSLVRHPIYAGYIVTHLAFLAANPRLRNILIVIFADTTLIVRALMEERVLANDEAYQTYCSRVSWHLVPGLF